jgi:RNA polymerase sigma-70 factor (family 1)
VKGYRSYSDAELTGLLKLSDENAFKEIYERYNSLLYIHAFKKLPNREEAKDVIQEVFSMIWDRREAFEVKTNLAGYLYTCVHHKILDHFIHLKTANKYIDSLQHFLDENRYTTDHLVREKQLSEIIEHEIAALPPKMRVVFELSRKDHLSHKEIAEQLGISEETVKSQIKNALKILRIKLGLLSFLVILMKI